MKHVLPTPVSRNSAEAAFSRRGMAGLPVLARWCTHAPDVFGTSRYQRVAIVVALTLALAACGGSGGGAGDNTGSGENGPSVVTTTNDGDNTGVINDPDTVDTEPDTIPPALCSVPDINQWVDDSMRDYYYFYDQVPEVNLAEYDTPEELVRALRVQPYDQFSYVTDVVTNQVLTQEGRTYGVGFLLLRDRDNQLRIARSHSKSPMGLAGIRRGDLLVAVNGIAIEDWDYSDFVDAVSGSPGNDVTAVWEFADGRSGESKIRTITSTEYELDTVLATDWLINNNTGRRAGYLVLDRFIRPTQEAAYQAIVDLKARGIDDFIIDLRYNGGGLVNLALELAGAIGGAAITGQPAIEYRYNDRYAEFNEFLDFPGVPEEASLDLPRVVILTTGRTASASELVINALKPYIDVTVIGSRTRGKPYVSRSRDYCEKRLFAIRIENFNAAGVSVYGGLEPDCPISDDLTRDFGFYRDEDDNVSIEGMLLAGLNFLNGDGSCPDDPSDTIVSDAGNTDRLLPRNANTTFEVESPQLRPAALDE